MNINFALIKKKKKKKKKVSFLIPCITHPYPYHTAGTFGQVLECWDRETREIVAIKVVRSIKKYREAAMIEIDVLQLLGKYDRNGCRYVYFLLIIISPSASSVSR